MVPSRRSLRTRSRSRSSQARSQKFSSNSAFALGHAAVAEFLDPSPGVLVACCSSLQQDDNFLFVSKQRWFQTSELQDVVCGSLSAS